MFHDNSTVTFHWKKKKKIKKEFDPIPDDGILILDIVIAPPVNVTFTCRLTFVIRRPRNRQLFTPFIHKLFICPRWANSNRWADRGGYARRRRRGWIVLSAKRNRTLAGGRTSSQITKVLIGEAINFPVN